MVIECGLQSEDKNMNKQIKRLLLTELSSKRRVAKCFNEDLPVIVKRLNDEVTFYMLVFDEDNALFNFEKCVKIILHNCFYVLFFL